MAPRKIDFCFPESLNVPRGEVCRTLSRLKMHAFITCKSKVQAVVVLLQLHHVITFFSNRKLRFSCCGGRGGGGGNLLTSVFQTMVILSFS